MSAPSRSPVLGYNHNVRHRGIVFHVQTEDSGVDNPHLYTHIFQGGVILASRRLEYDAEASEETVKALMQAQHKAVLRDLKHGAFDDKIDQYFGDQVDDRASETASDSAESPAAGERADTVADAAPVALYDGGETEVEVSAGSGAEAEASGPSEAITGEVTEPMEEGGADDVEAALDAVRERDASPPRDAAGAFRPSAPKTGREVGDGREPAPARPSGPGGREPGRDSAPPRIPHPDDDRPGQYRRRRPTRDVVDSPLAKAAQGARRDSDLVRGDRARRDTEAQEPLGHEARRAPQRPGGGASPPGPESGAEAAAPKPDRSAVVVSRPSVIVGGPGGEGEGGSQAPREASHGHEGRGRRRPSTDKRRREGLFGQDLISEKSLDEVILAYLSEDGSEE